MKKSSIHNPTGLPGMGYIVQTKENLQQKLPPVNKKPQSAKTNLTEEIDQKVENSIIRMLEQKCQEMTIKYDQENAAKVKMSKKLEIVINQNHQMQHQNEDLNIQIDSLRRQLNKIQIELDQKNRLIQQNQISFQSEVERSEQYKELYDREAQMREDEQAELNQEIKQFQQIQQNLQIRIQQLEQQNHNLEYQKCEMVGEIDYLKKQLEEKELNSLGIQDTQQSQMQKNNLAVCESAILQKKIKELEQARDKNHEIQKSKDDEIKKLKNQIQVISEKLELAIQDRKYAIKMQEKKDQKIQQLQDKIYQLQCQLQVKNEEQVTKEVKKVSKEKLIAVQAQPDLFD